MPEWWNNETMDGWSIMIDLKQQVFIFIKGHSRGLLFYVHQKFL